MFLKPFFLHNDEEVPRSRGYLVCEVETNGLKTIGLLSLLSLDVFQNNNVYQHEQTLTECVKELSSSLQKMLVQENPILITHPHQHQLDSLFQNLITQTPLFDFVTENMKYRLWMVNDSFTLKHIDQSTQHIYRLYLADGHHRVKALSQNWNTPLSSEPQVLAYIVSDKYLRLKGFHKLIYPTPLSADQLLNAISQFFIVEAMANATISSDSLGIYIGGCWNKLTPKADHPYQLNTPACFVDHFIFEEVLSIKQRAGVEKNILSVPHGVSIERLQSQVDSGLFQFALHIPPMTWDVFYLLAHKHYLLSPNTTYFEPKLNHGVISFKMDEYCFVNSNKISPNKCTALKNATILHERERL